MPRAIWRTASPRLFLAASLSFSVMRSGRRPALLKPLSSSRMPRAQPYSAHRCARAACSLRFTKPGEANSLPTRRVAYLRLLIRVSHIRYRINRISPSISSTLLLRRYAVHDLGVLSQREVWESFLNLGAGGDGDLPRNVDRRAVCNAICNAVVGHRSNRPTERPDELP